MTLRCGCPNDGDEIVFGPRHECTSPAPIEGLVPSWAFVVPAETPAEIVLDEDERHDR